MIFLLIILILPITITVLNFAQLMLSLEFKSYFEELGIDVDIELEDDVLYPVINKKLCIGCRGLCSILRK